LPGAIRLIPVVMTLYRDTLAVTSLFSFIMNNIHIHPRLETGIVLSGRR